MGGIEQHSNIANAIRPALEQASVEQLPQIVELVAAGRLPTSVQPILASSLQAERLAPKATGDVSRSTSAPTIDPDQEGTYLRTGDEVGPVAVKRAEDAWEKFDSLEELAASMGVSTKEAQARLGALGPCDFAEASIDEHYGWWAWAAVDESGLGYVELMGGEWGEPKSSTFNGKDVDLRELVLSEVVGSCEEYCGMVSEPCPKRSKYSVEVSRAISPSTAPKRPKSKRAKRK